MPDAIKIHISHPANGTQTVFHYDFDDQLSAVSSLYVIVEYAGVETQPVAGVDYTVNSDNKTITFAIAPRKGAIITIRRYTARDRHIDYEGGATITEHNLDEDPNRLTAVTQEIEGDLMDSLRLNAAGTKWNARGLEGSRAGPATAGDSWITLAQAEALVGGITPTQIDSSQVFRFTGDGHTVNFELVGFVGLTRSLINVYVENVPQSARAVDPVYNVLTNSSVGYPGPPGGNDYLQMLVAPVEGAEIEVRFLRGTVAAQLPTNSVTGGMIQDDAVGLQHINVGPGVNRRLLVFDPAGDPTARVGVHDDIADFDAAVIANKLNHFALPDGAMNFNMQRLTCAGLATDPADAPNYGQVLGLIGGAIQARWRRVTASTMPTVVDNHLDLPIGFKPDLVFLTAKYAASGSEGQWLALFDNTTNDRRLEGGGLTGASQTIAPPELNIGRAPGSGQSTLRIILKRIRGLTAWADVTYLAIKFTSGADPN